MNILICSVGRRVKLVEFFKEELVNENGMVIAVDCDPTAPALYHADKYEIVPRINHPEYIHHLKDVCRKYKVDGMISLIDPELLILASFKEELEIEGVKVIVSRKEVVDICYDKYETFRFLRDNEIPFVPTFVSMDQVFQELNEGKINFPLIVKPKNGSASIGIRKIDSMAELIALQNNIEEFIIQPFLHGEEFGVDCYIDLLTNETTNIFTKKKLRMRAGETDKSISFKDRELTQMIEQLIGALQPLGPIDIDCFKTENGYVVSEINPRFGGGYPHAHISGQNFVKKIINNLNGIPNISGVDNYEEGTMMVKYENIKILKNSNQLTNATLS